MASLEENLKTMVGIFRRECHRILESERTTVRGADGMLTVLQLVMAELNKEETGEFGVTLSDVIVAWKHLLWDKSNLPQDGSLRPQNYDIIRKEYDSFLKQTNTVDLIDIHGMYERLRGDSDPENPLCSVQLLQFLSGDTETCKGKESTPPCPTTPSSKPSQCSSRARTVSPILFQSMLRACKPCAVLIHITGVGLTYRHTAGVNISLNFVKCRNEKFSIAEHFALNCGEYCSFELPYFPGSPTPARSLGLKRLFCSYMDLLVNTRDDLALAHTLNIPNRALGRLAFTDLKRAARASSTSLFLAATSFVRAIQLGGKGYAPPESDPLRKHLKGLSDFVHFTDHLEELLGEIPDPSVAGARMVSIISAALLKGRSSGDPVCRAVEEVSRDLKERISLIYTAQREAACCTGISPARPRAHVINHATAYGGREAVKLLMALLDEEALAPPCRNKAVLLSQDLDALDRAGGTNILMLFQSPEAPTGSFHKPLQLRIQDRQDRAKPTVKVKAVRSQFACTYQDEDLPLNRVLEFPSSSQAPTCVHPAPKRTTEEEGEDQNAEGFTVEMEGAVQRAALGSRSANPPLAGSLRTQDHASRGGSCGQAGSKASKRKQVDRSSEAENQPPRKRAPKPVSLDQRPRATGRGTKRRLIAGQATLTSFLRL